jgi:hypothetical protein
VHFGIGLQDKCQFTTMSLKLSWHQVAERADLNIGTNDISKGRSGYSADDMAALIELISLRVAGRVEHSSSYGT